MSRVYNFSAGPAVLPEEVLETAAKEMLDLRMRVVELENAVKDMPSKVDVENLRGELNSLNKQMDSVQHGVRRIEQWLIDNKK